MLGEGGGDELACSTVSEGPAAVSLVPVSAVVDGVLATGNATGASFECSWSAAGVGCELGIAGGGDGVPATADGADASTLGLADTR